MHRMSDSFERDGAQWQSRIRCFSRRVQRCGELCMDRSQGELQGSDRAEVWAILQLLERTLGDLVIGTDCDCVVKCFRKRWWGCQGCYKNGRVTVCKVRAHVLAPDSPHELAAHTWTSVVGNELADAFAEKGALLQEVPVDVVKTIWEADSLVVRIQKQLYATATQAFPELKGPFLVASPHALFRDPLVLQGQWHCTSCGHTIAHKCLRVWLRNLLPAYHSCSLLYLRSFTRSSWCLLALSIHACLPTRWRTDAASVGVLLAERGPLLRHEI